MIKQTLIALIASSSLTSAALAQTAAPPPADSCALPQIADQAPLQQMPDSDLMTVPVAVNGTTEQFLLDVGMAKPTRLSPELMAKLSLPEIPKNYGFVGSPGATTGGSANFGSTGFAGAGGMGMSYCDVETGMGCASRETHVRVGSFGIGDATGHHLQFKVAEKGEIARTALYQGYLTGDFFRQYDVELDFAGKHITWLTASKCTDPDKAVFWAHHEVAIIPVTLAKDGRYQMQAMVGGHLINAELDTSSPRTVMRRDVAERYVGLKADTPQMLPLPDTKDGMGMQIYLSNFPQIVFAGGGVTAENVPVLVQDYSMIPVIDRMTDLANHMPVRERIPDLAIGMDVLQHLHMYVVPGVGRVYVTSAGDEEASPN